MDGSGTLATEDRLKEQETLEEEENGTEVTTNGIEDLGASAIPINENLFLEEDLDALDEELKDLDLEE